MYLIIFKLPSGNQVLKLKVNRFLRKIDAKMILKGVWRHEDVSKLINLASLIKSMGGKALVLEENIIYK